MFLFIYIYIYNMWVMWIMYVSNISIALYSGDMPKWLHTGPSMLQQLKQGAKFELKSTGECTYWFSCKSCVHIQKCSSNSDSCKLISSEGFCPLKAICSCASRLSVVYPKYLTLRYKSGYLACISNVCLFFCFFLFLLILIVTECVLFL